MKPITVLVLALAPFLSLTDAAHGAPAGAVKLDAAKHRRAAVESPDSPWLKRAEKRQGGSGPPTVISVSLPAADPSPNQNPTDNSSSSTTTTTTTTTTTDSSTDASSSTSTSSSTDSSSSTTDSSSTSTVDSSSSTSTSNIIDLPTISLSLPTDSSTSTTDVPTSTTPTDTPTSTTTPDQPTSTSTTTDCGLLGLGCVIDTLTNTDTSTSTDTPPVTDTTTTSSTDAPPPVSTTTSPDGTDTVTSTSTTTSTTDVVSITNVFPTTTTGIDSVVTTVTDTTTSVAPISIDSQYQFITASSFLVAPTTTTTTGSVTITDPDAALTTLTLTNSGGAVTLTAPVIPSSIPMFITPPSDSNPVPLGTDLPGYTEISILFQMTASWVWVLDSSDTAAQILAYLPPMIERALGCSDSDECIRTVGLKAFEPADMQSVNDLMTMYVGQLKSDQVNTLASIIKDPTSSFYNSGDSVADSVAKNIVMSFNIATLSGVSNENGSNSPSTSTTTKLDNSRRNAIIGVSVAFGLIALVVIGWWMMKSYKARQEAAHKRLSYTNEKTYGTAAEGAGLGGGYGRADSPPMLQNPFLSEREREDEARGIRRNSFYAIGPDDASLEEETFDYMSHRSSHNSGAVGLRRETSGGSGGRGGAGWGTATQDRLSPSGSYSNHPYARRPVVGQPISQPILRESSMGNW